MSVPICRLKGHQIGRVSVALSTESCPSVPGSLKRTFPYTDLVRGLYTRCNPLVLICTLKGWYTLSQVHRGQIYELRDWPLWKIRNCGRKTPQETRIAAKI